MTITYSKPSIIIAGRHGETPENCEGGNIVQEYRLAASSGFPNPMRPPVVLRQLQDTCTHYKVLSGDSQIGLTSKGVEQARNIGLILAEKRIVINQWVTTGVQRTHATLALAMEQFIAEGGTATDWRAITEYRLVERIPGDLQGRSRNELTEQDLAPLSDPLAQYPGPWGESTAMVAIRAAEAIKDLLAYEGATFVACHEIVLKALMWLAALELPIGPEPLTLDQIVSAYQQKAINPHADKKFSVGNGELLTFTMGDDFMLTAQRVRQAL